MADEIKDVDTLHIEACEKARDDIASHEFAIRTGWEGTPGTEACELLRRAVYLIDTEAKLVKFRYLFDQLGYREYEHFGIGRDEPLFGGQYRIRRYVSNGGGPLWHIAICPRDDEEAKLKSALALSGLLDGWDGDETELEEAFYSAGSVTIVKQRN